jgi:RND family efflux transporter MFP subunit
MKALMKKRVSKIVLAVVLCGVVAFPLIRVFKSNSASMTLANLVLATVQRGNLTVSVTGTGNLALSTKVDLTFNMSGTVQEVLVGEGDTVEKGQVIATLDTSEWETQLITLKEGLLQAKMSLENAEMNLEKTEEATTSEFREWQIEIDEMQVTLAEDHLKDAEKALEEANEASPEVTAPFDGFITKVNVSGGDEVKKGTVAATLADPNEFAVDILVSEMDISQVDVGRKGIVKADAAPTISLPAKVTHISPTATIQQGVVNYKVTVEVESPEAVAQEQQTAGQAVVTPKTSQFREGMSVTVNIIIQEKKDVLLVPNGAITTQGGQSYVQMISSNSTIAWKAIKTGITNDVNTEVTDGLSQGERVVLPQTTTTTTTTQQGGQGGGMFIPGIGRGGL